MKIRISGPSFFASLLVWAAFLLPNAHGQQGPDKTLPAIPLTNSVQILDQPAEEAEKKRPIFLKGVITCFDDKDQLWFLQDSTAGVYLYLPLSGLELVPGDLVEVKGHADMGLFSPIAVASSVQKVGSASLPVPKKVAIEDLGWGKEDSQWVEVTGVVRTQTEHWGHLVLEIVSGTSNLRLRVLNFPAAKDIPSFVDARIRVQGVAGTHYNNKRQLTGFHLLVPTLKQIEITEPPTADPFALPVRQTKTLLAYSRKGIVDHRVRVRGTVLLGTKGSIFLKDESGSIEVETTTDNPPLPGQIVEVAGFPAQGGYNPKLEKALVKIIGQTNQPTAIDISQVQASSGEFDSELVRITGTLIEDAESSVDAFSLLLESSNKLFRAILPKEYGSRAGLLSRSLLRVTGICSVDLDETGAPTRFLIRVRSPADIEVLSKPSWWKLNRMIGILISLAAIVAVGSSWLFLVRRKVTQRTEVIRKREAALEERYKDLFENANDIIYAHDLSGHLTSLNRAGEKIIGIKLDDKEKRFVEDLIAPEFKKLAREKTEQKLAGALRTNYEIEILALSGRRLILEINSRLQYLEGRVIGVQGIARDITGRKKAEEALRQSEHQLRQSMEEKERIARDLHDGIIQSIYAVGLNMEDCKRLVAANPIEVEKRLGTLMQELNRVIRDVRNFILGLESDSLRGQEFKTALKSLILTVGESRSSRCDLQIDPVAAGTISPNQAMHLLHIAREAMSNSLRHAQANRTIFSLQKFNDLIRFEVQDDGKGFNADSLTQRGFGLRNMQTRAENMGATFSIISQVGEGTRIVLDIPIKKQHHSVR